MSSEGEPHTGHYELKASNEVTEGRISGSVGIVQTPDGWVVETFDDEGVRYLPRIWDSFELADAFALGYIEGLDQGLLNAIAVLDKVHAIDKSKIEIMPQKVTPHGDDD